MTAQAFEKIIVNGVRYSLYSEPLESYLETIPDEQNFDYRTTGCWRGYIGLWQVKNDKLYLIDLEGTKIKSKGKMPEDVGLDFLFPGQKTVFADWFTGKLEVPQDTIQISGMPYYGEMLFLEFNKGILVDFKTVNYLEKMVNEVKPQKIEKEKGFWKKLKLWFLK